MELLLKINTAKILTLEEIRALEGSAKKQGISFDELIAACLKKLVANTANEEVAK